MKHECCGLPKAKIIDRRSPCSHRQMNMGEEELLGREIRFSSPQQVFESSPTFLELFKIQVVQVNEDEGIPPACHVIAWSIRGNIYIRCKDQCLSCTRLEAQKENACIVIEYEQ